MATVIASKIPNSVSIEKVQEFFTFCGSIKTLSPIDKAGGTSTYEITFESEKAISTALLLNDAELDGSNIVVEEKKDGTKKETDLPPPYSSEGAVAGEGDHKVQDATKTGDDNYDDIPQEEKPKYAIMAQILASGYSVSDKVIQKSIEVDNSKGYSTKFKNFLSSLDEKYIHANEPESSANKNISKAQSKFSELQSSFSKSKYSDKLSHYFDKAASHPYGAKVHEFYKTLAKDVREVHNEALRLKQLKAQESSSSSSAPASEPTAATTSAGEFAAKN